MTLASPNTNPNPSPPPVPLAPGFRFHPTDEELVIYYLKRKILNRPLKLDAIAEIDLYKLEPWELPTKSRIRSRDLEWYFFSPLDRKYSNKSRTNRATKEGYWKTTGKDREVKRGEKIVGMKKTLVFHMGRAPSGKRTNWVMHEYRIEGDGVLDELSAVVTDKTQELYVVCRIFQKMGSGPQNGAQYGAPFIEEEWEQETGGDEPMAALMAVEKDEEDEDHEYAQMHDPLPTQTTPNPDPSLANTDLDAIPNPPSQPIKQEIEENTTENQETTNESYIVSEWVAQDTSSWPLRTRGDQSLPNSSEDNATLSELLNVEEFFNDTIEDDDNGSNCETGQENDSIKPALLCDYEYLGAEEDEGKTVFYDVDDNAEVSDGRYLDDLMAYFDETEVDIKYDISQSSQIIEESKNVEEETKEMYKGESSSSVKPSFEETNQLKRKTFEMSDFEDIHGDEYNDKSSIRKRLVSMLGSISAPAAIASEFSASSSKMTNPNSAGPIRVTAGIIQIINLQRDDESFLMGTKNRDLDLVLKLDPVDKMDEVAVFTVFRGGFYLCFVSMAILTLSYKLSMCIYGR